MWLFRGRQPTGCWRRPRRGRANYLCAAGVLTRRDVAPFVLMPMLMPMARAMRGNLPRTGRACPWLSQVEIHDDDDADGNRFVPEPCRRVPPLGDRPHRFEEEVTLRCHDHPHVGHMAIPGNACLLYTSPSP